MSNTSRMLPWLWTGLVATAVIWLVATQTKWAEQVDWAPNVVAPLGILLIATFGSLITSRQPGNRIAWLFHVISIGLLISIPTSERLDGFTARVSESPTFWDIVSVVFIFGLSGSVLFAVFLILYLFPSGRFLSRRWAWAGWISATFVPTFFVSILFSERFTEAYTETPSWVIENPIGFVPEEIGLFLGSTYLFLLLAIAVGGVVAMWVRFRRSDVVARTQIKWVLFAAVVALASLPLGFGDFRFAELLMLIAFLLIPVAVTIAITRYKLFEIDRVISRTITYAVVVAALGGLFALGAVWVPTRFLGGQSPVLVAGSTLAAAALFNPLRRNVQKSVDRRFNRSSYRVDRVAEEFASQLQESLTVDELADVWVDTIDTHLQPAVSGIWVRRAKRTE